MSSVMVVLRKSELAEPVPDSTEIECTHCHRACWLSPSGKETLNRVDMSVVCDDCMLTQLKKLRGESADG